MFGSKRFVLFYFGANPRTLPPDYYALHAFYGPGQINDILWLYYSRKLNETNKVSCTNSSILGMYLSHSLMCVCVCVCWGR